MKKIVLLCLLYSGSLFSQDQASDSLLLPVPEEKTTGTFHSTRVIQSQSVEMLAKGALDVRILHRFGKLSDGVKELFGLDQATIRVGLEYGISDRLTIGAGRSSYEKTYDGFIKYK